MFSRRAAKIQGTYLLLFVSLSSLWLSTGSIISREFVLYASYNGIAETKMLIILYLQAKQSKRRAEQQHHEQIQHLIQLQRDGQLGPDKVRYLYRAHWPLFPTCHSRCLCLVQAHALSSNYHQRLNNTFFELETIYLVDMLCLCLPGKDSKDSPWL